jgi:hypothetical protein
LQVNFLQLFASVQWFYRQHQIIIFSTLLDAFILLGHINTFRKLQSQTLINAAHENEKKHFINEHKHKVLYHIKASIKMLKSLYRCVCQSFLWCVRLSFTYVAHFLFLRDVWIRTQRAAVASRRATSLAIHLPVNLYIVLKLPVGGLPLTGVLPGIGCSPLKFIIIHVFLNISCKEKGAR